MPPNGGGGVPAAPPAAGQSQPAPPTGPSPTFDLSTVFVMNGLIPHSYSNVTSASVMPPMQLPQPLTVGASGGNTTPTSTTPQPGVVMTPAPGQCSPTIQTPPSGILPPGDYCHAMMMSNPHLGQMYMSATGQPGAMPQPHPLASAINARYNLMSYPPPAPVGQPQAAMSYAPSMSQMAAVSAGIYHPGVVNTGGKPHHERGAGGGRRNDERNGGYRNGGGGRRNHGTGGGYYSGNGGGYYQGQHSHNNQSGGGNERGAEKGYYNNGGGGYRENRSSGHNRPSYYYETNNAFGLRTVHNESYNPSNNGAPLISQPPINIVPNTAAVNSLAAIPPASSYDQQGANNSSAGPRNRDNTSSSYTVPLPPPASSVTNSPTASGAENSYSNASSPMHISQSGNNDLIQQHHESGEHENVINNHSHSRPANRGRGSAGDANAAVSGNLGPSATSSTSSLSQASSTAGSYRRPKHFPNYVSTKDGSRVIIVSDDPANVESIEAYPIKHKFDRVNGGGRNAGISPSSAQSPSLALASVHPRSNSAGSTTIGLGPNSISMSRSSGSFSQRSNSRLGHHNQHHNVHTSSASNPMTPEDPDFNLLANAFPPLPGTEETNDDNKIESGEISKKNKNESNSSENEIVRPSELTITSIHTSGDSSRCLSPQSLADVVKGNVHHHYHHNQQPQQSSKTSQSSKNSSANIEVVQQQNEPENVEASTSQPPTSTTSIANDSVSSQQQSAALMKRPSSAASAAAVVFSTTDVSTSVVVPVVNKSKSVTNTPTHQVHEKSHEKSISNGTLTSNQQQQSINGDDANNHSVVEHVNGGGHPDSPDSADNLSSSSSVTSNAGGRLTYSQIAQKKEAQQQLMNNSNYQLPQQQQHQSHQPNLVAMATVAANATGVNQQNHQNSNLVMFPHLLTNNHHHHLHPLNNVHLGGGNNNGNDQTQQQHHFATLNHPIHSSHQASASLTSSNSLASSPISSVKDGSTRPRSVVVSLIKQS